MQYKAAALIIGLAHHTDIVIAVSESFDCRILAGRRRAHDGILMDLDHLRDDLLRTAGISQSPSGHGISLGETVYNNGSFLHAGQRSNGNMRLSCIGKFAVDLIGKHIEIMLDDDLTNCLQIFFFHDPAGRIVWIRQDQDFGTGCDRGFELFRCQAELIFIFQIDNDRDRICKDSTGLIGDIRRLRDQDLIALVDHSPEHQIDGFRTADRNEYLLVPGIINVLGAFHIIADFLPQLLQTRIGCIEGPAFLQ